MSGRLLILIRHGDYKKWSHTEEHKIDTVWNRIDKASCKRIVRIISSTCTMVRVMDVAEIIGFSFPESKKVFDQTLNEGKLNSAST